MTEPLMNITIGDLLHTMATRYPNREMIKYTDRDYRRTWREFDEEVDRIAKGFLGMGVKNGDHVPSGPPMSRNGSSPCLPPQESVPCW